jgi:hypothetical protein
MNEFERKLSKQSFRAQPAALRAAIFDSPHNVVTPVGWTWRDWFWPSPQAWGALAALWVFFAVLSLRNHETTPAERFAGPPPSARLTLLTFHHAPTLDHVLEFSN